MSFTCFVAYILYHCLDELHYLPGSFQVSAYAVDVVISEILPLLLVLLLLMNTC